MDSQSEVCKFCCRRWLALVMLMGLVCLQACDQPTADQPALETPPSDLQRPLAVPGESAATRLSTPRQEDQDLMSLDPQQDGWETEHLNAVAGKQLKKLGAIFESDQFADTTQLASVFNDVSHGRHLKPAKVAVVFEADGTQVLRPEENDSPQIPADVVTWSESLSKLTDVVPRDAKRHSKFKIIRVQPKADGFTTTQLVLFDAHLDSLAWEMNATWDVEWGFSEKGTDPKIVGVEVKTFEEVTSSKNGNWFTDCTAAVMENEQTIAEQQFAVGVDQWVERLNEYQLVMQFGHNGLAIGDVNSDGIEDVFRAQLGGLPNRLLLGQPDGTLKDHTAAAGLGYLDNTRGALLVDLDNDGDQDLVLAMPLEVVIWTNDGSARFEIQSRFPLKNVFSLAAADFDEDGDLDIYTCVYYAKAEEQARIPVPMPTYDATNGGENVLLRNEGDGKFTDATNEVGLNADNSRFSYSAIWEDYDNDGHIDLFVANDFGLNNLYRNEGGKFQHVTEQSGTANGSFGMSAASADFNHDGWVDIYKASMYSSAGNRVVTQPQFMPDADPKLRKTMLQLAQGNTLFTNAGDGTFRDESLTSRVEMGRWSWGSVFVDFNNDGWEDLYVTNGFVTGRRPDDL